MIEYLEKVGIGTASTKAKPTTATQRYSEIRTALLEAYDVIEADVDPNRKKRPS